MKKLIFLTSAAFLLTNPVHSAFAQEAESEVIREAQGEKEPEFSKIIEAPKGIERKSRAKIISKADAKERQPKVAAVIGPEGLKNLKNRDRSAAPILTADYLEKIKEKEPENLITAEETVEKTEE